MERYGGAAFPSPSHTVSEADLPIAWQQGGDEGMTLLDYFAGQALVEMVRDKNEHPDKYEQLAPIFGMTVMEVVAERSYGQAEAMLDRRKALMGNK